PARSDGARARDRVSCALGPRLGGRGDERRVAAAARRPEVRSAETGAPAAATQGRWSLADRLFETRLGTFPGQVPDRRALAELLLERQGIVTRDGVRAEG